MKKDYRYYFRQLAELEEEMWEIRSRIADLEEEYSKAYGPEEWEKLYYEVTHTF